MQLIGPKPLKVLSFKNIKQSKKMTWAITSIMNKK